jgi:hypothetical protein
LQAGSAKLRTKVRSPARGGIRTPPPPSTVPPLYLSTVPTRVEHWENVTHLPVKAAPPPVKVAPPPERKSPPPKRPTDYASPPEVKVEPAAPPIASASQGDSTSKGVWPEKGRGAPPQPEDEPKPMAKSPVATPAKRKLHTPGTPITLGPASAGSPTKVQKLDSPNEDTMDVTSPPTTSVVTGMSPLLGVQVDTIEEEYDAMNHPAFGGNTGYHTPTSDFGVEDTPLPANLEYWPAIGSPCSSPRNNPSFSQSNPPSEADWEPQEEVVEENDGDFATVD